MREIGQEITEELEYEPGRLFVNRYIPPQICQCGIYDHRDCPLPERPLPKAIAGPGLLAQINHRQIRRPLTAPRQQTTA